jgi:hypothetical protein
VRNARATVATLTCLVALAACAAHALAPLPVVLSKVEAAPDGGLGAAAPARRSDVAVGWDRVCARIDGRVRCVSGRPDAPLASAKPLFDEEATSLAVGGDFVCITTARGRVRCLGSNEYGELGAGLREDESDAGVEVSGVSDARVVYAGSHHACAIGADQTVRCWGRNDQGQTGSATSYTAEARELVFASVVPGVRATALALGDMATCAITPNREVVCWGALRVPDPSGAFAYLPRPAFPIEGLEQVDDLGGGGDAFCAVERGEVYCWGGLERIVSTRSATVTPVRVQGVAGARSVGVRTTYACALMADGRIVCWGRNTGGQLGRGARGLEDAAVDDAYLVVSPDWPAPLGPETVRGVRGAVGLVVGYGMACATIEDGDVLCWGAWPFPYEEGRAPSIEPDPVPLRLR